MEERTSYYKFINLRNDYFKWEVTDRSEQVIKFSEMLGKKFGEKEYYGKFSNTEEYITTLNLLLSSTLEADHRDEILFREVLPKLSRLARTKTFLDIGVGNGDLTKRFAQYFVNVTVVDKNKDSLNNVPDYLAQTRNMVIEKIDSSILNYDLSVFDKKYDFILLSHVLYYIPFSQRLELVGKLYNLLNQDGLMVMIFNSGGSRSKLVRTFNQNFDDLEDLRHFFYNSTSSTNSSVCTTIYKTEEKFTAPNINIMKKISNVCLNDANSIATSKDLEKYFHENKGCFSNTCAPFEISMDHNIIILGNSDDC